MSRGLKQFLQFMVLSIPGAASALGLGDIRVESALNEPLSAQIDIVGATQQELSDLNAAIADRESFQRYGVDRPKFLASAHFKVSRDSDGRPVLLVHSDDSFTEPVVSLLVDLRWRRGELIREYSLLLDPADLASRAAAPAVASTLKTRESVPPPPAVTRVTESATRSTQATATPQAPPPTTTISSLAPGVIAAPAGVQPRLYRISSRDTLRGIARHAGAARGKALVQRTMIAIFRANPGAFDGNINRMHRGAVVTLPLAETVAAISANEARLEVRAQMASWHRRSPSGPASPPRMLAAAQALPRVVAAPINAAPVAAAPINPTPVATAPDAVASVAAAPASANVPARDQPASAAVVAAKDTLEQRIESLEHQLSDTNRVLTSEHQTLLGLQQYVADGGTPYPIAPVSAAPKPVPVVAAATAKTSTRRSTVIWSLTGAAVALLVIGALRRRSRRSPPAQKTVIEPLERSLLAALAETPIAPNTKPIQASSTSVVRESTAKQAESISVAKASKAEARSTRRDAADSASVTSPLPTQSAGDTTAVVALDIDAASFGEDTVNLAAPTERIPIDTARLTALTDLERALEHSYHSGEHSSTAQHVQMPSELNERAEIANHRTNIVDVLKKAIEQEPHRHDLRLKLLEVYFSAAQSNREAFLEVARKLAREGQVLSTADWEKVSALGSKIASDDPLFVENQKVSGKIADCA